MNIAIIGASGFLGTQLIKHLLTTTDYNVKTISRDTSGITTKPEYKNRLECIDASVRTIVPGSIPQGLLASLRPLDLEQ